MKKFILIFAVCSVVFACKKEKTKGGVFKGTEVALHDGKAWTSLTLDQDEAPQKISIVLNDAVLNSVPVGGSGDGHDDRENDQFLPLPAKALETTLFKTIMLDWNKNGHEPAGVYTLPHFDFHFYSTTATEIMNYTDPVKLNTAAPAAAYIPANHIAGPGIPMMGRHFIDLASPELNGALFTQTFLYGAYDTRVVFFEPMITLDFLKTTINFERPIPQPLKFQQDGYYPTKMHISKHDGVTEISLEAFVLRKGS